MIPILSVPLQQTTLIVGVGAGVAFVTAVIALFIGYFISRRQLEPTQQRNKELEKEVAALKESAENSEARFNLVASSISDALYVARISKQGETKFVYLSPNIQPISGYAPPFFSQGNDFGRTYVHPEDRGILDNLIAQLAEGKSAEADYRWVHGQSGVIWLRNNGQAVPDESGSSVTVYGLISDVTQRKNTEQALDDQKRLFENLLVIAQATTGHPTLEGTLHSILDIVMMLTGIYESSRSSLFVFDDKGAMAATLLSQTGHTFQRKRRFVSEVVDKGLIHWVVEHRQKALLFDTSVDDRWLATAEDATTAQSALAVPILSGASLLAVLTLTHPDIGYFTMEHVYLLEAASNQIALAVRNAQMHDAQIRQTDRQRTLYETLRTVSSHLDLKEVAQIAVETVAKETHWPVVEILLPDESGQNFVVEAATGQGASNTGFSISADKGIIGRAIRENKMQYAPNVAKDRDFVEASITIRSELAVPLYHSNRMLGVLDLLSDEQNAFDRDDILLAESLAEALGLAFDNARLHKELVSAKETAESANQAKSEFVSIVSHELKNPMTSIRGYADLLAAGAVGPLDEQQKNFVKTISVNVGRMQTLVSDLTDVSRIESGHVNLEFGAVPMIDVVGDVVRTMQNQFEAKNQKLIIDADDDLPLVWGDRNRLVQIMVNLLSNASKYTPNEGSVSICVSNYAPNGNGESKPVVQVSIVDDGIGISEEDQKKMFQKFYRAPDREARQSPGTGLGLNITKNLVELQDGRIWFESEFRKGTAFHFTIPAATND